VTPVGDTVKTASANGCRSTEMPPRKARLPLHTSCLSLATVSPIGPLPAKTMSPSLIASRGRVARRPDPIVSSHDGQPRHTTGHVCQGFGKWEHSALGTKKPVHVPSHTMRKG
jgi:hypothetical protein